MNNDVQSSDPFSGWFIFVGTVVAATAAAVAFLFLQFQTRAEANTFRDSVEQRLIRIEEKIDAIKRR